MDSQFNSCRASGATKAPSDLDLSTLGLLLLSLLANLSSREEVYTNPEYGFSVLALFGAAGCIGHLAASLSQRPGALDFAGRLSFRILPTSAVPRGVSRSISEWPVLVALLFGPLVFLLSGLGGWV